MQRRCSTETENADYAFWISFKCFSLAAISCRLATTITPPSTSASHETSCLVISQHCWKTQFTLAAAAVPLKLGLCLDVPYIRLKANKAKAAIHSGNLTKTAMSKTHLQELSAMLRLFWHWSCRWR